MKPGTHLSHLLSLLLHREVRGVTKLFSNVAGHVYEPTDGEDDESTTDYLPIIKALIRLCARSTFTVRGGFVSEY